MKLHEYQAKALLAPYGVPTPQGEVARSAQEAAAAAERLGGKAVVKAQVHAGGRGKAGGVKVAASAREAGEIAEGLIGASLVTAQTGPQGAPVHSVLVEQTVDLARELYVSITTDGSRKRPVVIASAAGGVEIEQVAESDPAAIITEPIDPVIGFQAYQGRRVAAALGLSGGQSRAFASMLAACHRAYVEKDLTMVEINPLVVTEQGALLALDAKVSLDDDALFRHEAEAALRDESQEDALEVEASARGIAYVKLDGDVGCMVNGAGLAMATMDTVKAAGADPANFLDVGGGANEEKVSQAIQLMLADPSVQRVLVNVFGGILRCDVVARGVADAYAKGDRQPPLVVRLLGTNVDEGKRILAESGIDLTLVDTLQEAAEAIKAAG